MGSREGGSGHVRRGALVRILRSTWRLAGGVGRWWGGHGRYGRGSVSASQFHAMSVYVPSMPVTSWGLAVTGVWAAECGTYWPPTVPPVLAHCCGL